MRLLGLKRAKPPIPVYGHHKMTGDRPAPAAQDPEFLVDLDLAFQTMDACLAAKKGGRVSEAPPQPAAGQTAVSELPPPPPSAEPIPGVAQPPAVAISGELLDALAVRVVDKLLSGPLQAELHKALTAYARNDVDTTRHGALPRQARPVTAVVTIRIRRPLFSSRTDHANSARPHAGRSPVR